MPFTNARNLFPKRRLFNPFSPNKELRFIDLWYVNQTKPKKEGDAASYLSTKGFEVFYPQIEDYSNRNGRVEKILKSLFPNYLFVKFDLERSYSLVRWAKGVKKVLGFGASPSPVAEEVINLIKKKTEARATVIKVYHSEPNDLIRIKSGPLKELTEIYDRWVSEGEHVRVLLNLIGYQPAIELNCSMLDNVA